MKLIDDIDSYVVKCEDITDRCRNQHKDLMKKNKNDLEITDEHWITFVQREQRNTLNKWLEFLNHLDCSIEVKKWILDSILKMAYLDKSTWRFRKRNKNTIHPFAEINEIAVLMSIENKKVDTNISFRKLYERNLKNLLTSRNNSGVWMSYNFNELDSLVDSINGWFTGWCITNSDVALVNLLAGNIHIFFSSVGDELIYPRIAIGMQDQKVRVCVGILENQRIEDELLPELSKKLSTLNCDYTNFQMEDIIRFIK